MNTNTNINMTNFEDAATNPMASSVQQIEAFHIYRIVDLESVPGSGWKKIKATLCRENHISQVSWWANEDANIVQWGQLVWFEHQNRYQEDGDALVVRGVYRAEAVNPDLNLIDTFPVDWLPRASRSEDVLADFEALWSQLSRQGRAWFNAVFWHQPGRWRSFVTAPASIKHHHAGRHGLFTHSVDVATKALRTAQGDTMVNVDVLILATLLHDLGKADDYLIGKRDVAYGLTERGFLMGHRLTTLEWMTAALDRLSPQDRPDEVKVMAVYHAINASHAQDWVGLPRPRTAEAFYLASADTLSGNCEMVRRLANPGSRKGHMHKALRGPVWVMGEAG